MCLLRYWTKSATAFRDKIPAAASRRVGCGDRTDAAPATRKNQLTERRIIPNGAPQCPSGPAR